MLKRCFSVAAAICLMTAVIFQASALGPEPDPGGEPQGVLMSSMEVTVGEDSQVTVNEVEIPALEEESTLSHDQLVAMSTLQGVTGQLDYFISVVKSLEAELEKEAESSSEK